MSKKKVVAENPAPAPEVKPEVEFNHMFDVIAGSNSAIPANAIIGILARLVDDSRVNREELGKFILDVKEKPIEEIIEKTILMTCNSVLTNIYKLFGPELEELYKKNQEKKAEGGDA